MSEEELLRKIALAAIEMRRTQQAASFHTREHYKKFGRFWSKSDEAEANHKTVVVSARNEARESRRTFDGYLFMYEVQQWKK